MADNAYSQPKNPAAAAAEVDSAFRIITSRFKRTTNEPETARMAMPFIDQAIAKHPTQLMLYVMAIDVLCRQNLVPALLKEKIEPYLAALEQNALQPQLRETDDHDVRRTGYMLNRLQDLALYSQVHRTLDVVECIFKAPGRLFSRSYAAIGRVCFDNHEVRRANYAADHAALLAAPAIVPPTVAEARLHLIKAPEPKPATPVEAAPLRNRFHANGVVLAPDDVFSVIEARRKLLATDTGGNRAARSSQAAINTLLAKYPQQKLVHVLAMHNIVMQHNHLDDAGVARLIPHIEAIKASDGVTQEWTPENGDAERVRRVMRHLKNIGQLELAKDLVPPLAPLFAQPERVLGKAARGIARDESLSPRRRRRVALVKKLRRYRRSGRTDAHDDAWGGYEVQRPQAPTNGQWEYWMDMA